MSSDSFPRYSLPELHSANEFRSEPKGNFFGALKDAGIGREKNTWILLGILFFISSNQQKRYFLLVWYLYYGLCLRFSV